MFEALVLVLFGSQLHELTWRRRHRQTARKERRRLKWSDSSAQTLTVCFWFLSPLTRSSITWDSTLTTVMFPIRANAMEAADRMKSPAKMAYERKTHSHHVLWTFMKQEMRLWLPDLSLPPQLVDGSLPSPFVRAVDDVVVHQAGGVDHLWDHGDGSLPGQQVPADGETLQLKSFRGALALSALAPPRGEQLQVNLDPGGGSQRSPRPVAVDV